MSGEERWRPVVGFEESYLVSDHGQVRSIDRVIDTPRGPKRFRGQMLAPNRRARYFYANLSGAGGVRVNRSIHRMVLEAFVGPCPAGMECLHYDDDPANNHLSNLSWGTRSQNVRDCVRNGNHNRAAKTSCPQGHEYTPENIIWVKSGTARECKICRTERQLERKAAREAAPGWSPRKGPRPIPLSERQCGEYNHLPQGLPMCTL